MSEIAENKRLFSSPGIVEHHYRFCEWLLPKISKFQRDQRHILGVRLQNTALDVLEGLIDATIADATVKHESLSLTAQSREHLRFHFRLAFSTRMINSKSYEYGCGVLIETGRMIGGWLKSTDASGAEDGRAFRRKKRDTRLHEKTQTPVG